MSCTYKPTHHKFLLWLLMVASIFSQAYTSHNQSLHQTAFLSVDPSSHSPIPPNFFGIFFEEINHAGSGGLWAELVSNRGFEAGGRHSPSLIDPWNMIGDEKSITITTELSSCFETNPVALRMDVHCHQTNCPPGGVGIYNPGFWGMNVEQEKTYNVVFYVRSSGPLHAVLSFVNSDGTQVLSFSHIDVEAEKVKNWTKMEINLKATGSYPKSRLQFTTTRRGTIWLDQVSAMPIDTYKGHGFRTDLMEMLLNLKPRFLRFPGGCYVEGNNLSNAFRWKETVGPWEERPGHYGDVWGYWSDDGLGYLEFLQLAEDLGAEPVWVINSGIAIHQQVGPNLIAPFVQEMLDSIEFARGSPDTKWGSLRAKLGHPAPFSLKYIAIGNENCGFKNYRGDYLKFYHALKHAYPDIKVISNCDATLKPLNHPADLFDYHKYTTAEGMLELTGLFEKLPRDPKAPKAFVSEYAVTKPKKKVVNGTFKGALAEAAFLLSLEKNSDVVEMVSYAPLFVNENDRSWSPDAIVFDSNKVYGISSYWVQTFFKESSGALLLKSYLQKNHQNAHIYATAISWMDNKEKRKYIKIKVVNFQKESVNLKISMEGTNSKSVRLFKETIFTSDNFEAENTFNDPHKVVPTSRPIIKAYEKGIVVMVKPYSFTAFDLINDGENPRNMKSTKHNSTEKP